MSRVEHLAEGVTLYLGDNREILPTLGLMDAFIFSPPYNLGNTSGGGFSNSGLGKRGGSGKWSGGALADGYGICDDNMPHPDYVRWQHQFLHLCWDHLSGNGAIFYNHKTRILNGVAHTPLEYNPSLPLRQIIIWARAGGINYSPSFYVPTHEWVLVLARPEFRLRDRPASGVGDVWYIPQGSDLEHPAPFPLELPSRILQTTSVKTVCDPFMGSGTTGIAAIKAGRKFVGIEIEPKFFSLACRRVQAALDAPDMFMDPPKSAKQEAMEI